MRAKPKRVVFAEGEEESVIRAAAAFQNSGMGKAILVGRADVVKRGPAHAPGIDENLLEIRVPHSAAGSRALYRRALQAHPAPRRACIATPCAWSPMTATSMPPPC